MDIDLAERLFEFAVRNIKFLKYIPREPEFRNINYQLSRDRKSVV